MSKERLTSDDLRLTAYVLGELDESERTQFEAELAKNPQLQAALDELRQAAEQVFAALQTEPGIALTDEQLERIRTAACAPSDPSPAMAIAASPAAGESTRRVSIMGAPPRSSVPRTVASSAIVLAGLVLTTAAIVLGPHFPRPGVDAHNFNLPDVAVLDNSSGWGAVDESLPPGQDASTTFAYYDVTALHGPVLNYDELRRAYRLEIPDNDGRVDIHYVGLVKALGRDDARGGESQDRPEQQDEAEPAADERSYHSFFGMADDNADSTLDTYGILNVADINANGRLDDDPLFYAPASHERAATEAATVTATVRETPLGLERWEAGATPPPASGETDGAQPDSDGDGTADHYFVVPWYAIPLAAENESLARQHQLQRGLARQPEDAEMKWRYFEDQRSRLGAVNGEAAPATTPAEAMPVGVAGPAPASEELRRLSEFEHGSRMRRFTSESLQQLDESLLRELEGTVSSRSESAREAGGQQQSGTRAPISGGLVDQLQAAERNAQDGLDQYTSPGQNSLRRGSRAVDGELLFKRYRERLGELSEQQEGEIAERDGQILRWQKDYRELQQSSEELNEEYRREWESRGRNLILGGRYWGRSDNGVVDFDSSLDVPFQQGSFELGVPDSGGHANRADTPGTESYAPIVENDFLPTLTEPVSTFSIDVDTGSYANCRRFINDGKWPPADAVRVEELVNAFTYNDPPPDGEHPIAVNFDVAACPWQPEHRLVRIGVRAADIIRTERPPTRLVFLIDVSGSMKDANKLPLVQQSLHLLVDELGENDRVAIVTYATEAALRLESTSGDDPETILTAVDALGANGSTNGEGGLRLAYQVAERQFEVEAGNRVILCTDGDFNVGETDNSELVRFIEEKRDSDVFLSVYGFGMGNLEDDKLEQIADHGNGQYGYIDSLEEAKDIFVHHLTGTLYTVAKDVKLQLDFNPAKVASYRLIGYENRALENADFDNDVVDAGDVGAGHSVTALYQVAPRRLSEDTDSADLAQAALDRFMRLNRNADQNVRIARQGTVLNIDGTVVSEVRKQETADYVTALLATPGFEGIEVRNNLEVAAAGEVPPAGEDLLKLRVRYKRPRADESRLFEATLVDDGTMQSPSADFQWASAVASYGMLLRQSRFRGDATFDAIIETARAAAGDDPHGRRREFIDLVLRSRTLYARQTGQSSPEPVELTSGEARDRATCDGKYSDLLDKLEVPEDLESYGAFRDYGYWSGNSYRNFADLRAGYWVYVYPHWYIWGESK